MVKIVLYGVFCLVCGVWIGYDTARRKFVSRVEAKIAEAREILKEIDAIDAEAGNRLDELKELYK